MTAIIALDAGYLERELRLINNSAISQWFWFARWHHLEHTRLCLHTDGIQSPTQHSSIVIFVLRFELQNVLHIVGHLQFGTFHRRSVEFPSKIVCGRI